MAGRPGLRLDLDYAKVFKKIEESGEQGISTTVLIEVLKNKYRGEMRMFQSKQNKHSIKNRKERHDLDRMTKRLTDAGLLKTINKKGKGGEKVMRVNYVGLTEKFIEWVLIGKYSANKFWIEHIKENLTGENSFENYIKSNLELMQDKSIEESLVNLFKRKINDANIAEITNDTIIFEHKNAHFASMVFMVIYTEAIELN